MYPTKHGRALKQVFRDRSFRASGRRWFEIHLFALKSGTVPVGDALCSIVLVIVEIPGIIKDDYLLPLNMPPLLFVK